MPWVLVGDDALKLQLHPPTHITPYSNMRSHFPDVCELQSPLCPWRQSPSRWHVVGHDEGSNSLLDRSREDGLELLEGGEGIFEAFEGGDIQELNQCLVYGCQLPSSAHRIVLSSS